MVEDFCGLTNGVWNNTSGTFGTYCNSAPLGSRANASAASPTLFILPGFNTRRLCCMKSGLVNTIRTTEPAFTVNDVLLYFIWSFTTLMLITCSGVVVFVTALFSTAALCMPIAAVRALLIHGSLVFVLSDCIAASAVATAGDGFMSANSMTAASRTRRSVSDAMEYFFKSASAFGLPFSNCTAALRTPAAGWPNASSATFDAAGLVALSRPSPFNVHSAWIAGALM